ncbi:hypothetical protein [Burkholderia gladioli]|uniref:hypothetical protein n=1 Tax=Burkholderia gladioli TaxID=28095 RepID=UPI001FC8A65B|nr:hypothetical protein [Burkholderia gladioli]
MSNAVLKTLAAAAALSLVLAACGGGGGSSGGGSTNTGTGTTATGTSNAQSLLAAYVVPDTIAADVVPLASVPAFTVGNSGIQSACAGSTVGASVVSTQDVVVFSGNGASLKAQELAADLAEQAIASVRTYFGQSATVGFDGTNKVQICVDTQLGVGQSNGTAITGQTALNVSQEMSADSPNFDARFPNAANYDGLLGLYRHEMTHAYNYAAAEPFGNGIEFFYLEGTAQNVAQEPLPDKATLLGYVTSTDLLSPTNNDSNLTVLPAYEAIINYLTSNAPGALNNGQASLQTLLSTFKADAMAVCAQPIPSGIIPAPAETVGVPAGDLNVCYSPPGSVDTRVRAAFDQAFNSTMKDSNGGPLLLHTADGANSLEATLYQRLNGYLP